MFLYCRSFVVMTRPVENVITTKGLQDRNIHILDGTTVENKGKIILTNINSRLLPTYEASSVLNEACDYKEMKTYIRYSFLKLEFHFDLKYTLVYVLNKYEYVFL